jgi:murein L,D-transpeptidase YafK
MKRSILIVIVLPMLLSGCSHNQSTANLEHADKILVLKSAHTLNLLSDGHIFRSYSVALGRNPLGAKARKGDHKTPEGLYTIDSKKQHSRFYRALHISYPDVTDKTRARVEGYDPGGDVENHGIENGLGWIGRLHRTVDWTDGCVALTDDEMDEIWSAVDVGTPVEIRP